MKGGKNRRTLKNIPYYPGPQEIYDRLMSAKVPYSRDAQEFRRRDKALISLLYLAGLRISEALRIRKKQFRRKGDVIFIRAIKLSKSRVKGQPRRVEYRDARLPLKGERSMFTDLVMDHVHTVDSKERIFPIGSARASQILKKWLPDCTLHWLRAFCEDYLYDAWEHDLLAVSDYIKVDPRTLELYLRKRHERYPAV